MCSTREYSQDYYYLSSLALYPSSFSSGGRDSSEFRGEASKVLTCLTTCGKRFTFVHVLCTNSFYPCTYFCIVSFCSTSTFRQGRFTGKDYKGKLKLENVIKQFDAYLWNFRGRTGVDSTCNLYSVKVMSS